MNQYRVEKESVVAALFLTDGARVDGTLYLSAYSPNHSGPQTVEDLMGEPGRMVPFGGPEGRFLLIGKASVAAVRVPLPASLLEGFWMRIAGQLDLLGSHHFEGNLLLEEGAGRRLSDALNAPDAWIPLEATDGLVWICKDHLITVEARGG